MSRKDINPDLYGCWLTNRSTYSKEYEFPEVYAFVDEKIDYLCLPGEKSKLESGNNNCLCFYVDDNRFDTIDGLYNAIIYRDNKKLKKYKEKYKDIKYVISPDYSTYVELSKAWIVNQINKARIVTLWFQLEIGCVAIPNITFSIEEYDDICLEGIVEGSTVAISMKSLMQKSEMRIRTKEVIKKVVDRIHPLMIVVYSVAKDDNTIKYFDYAIKNDVDICIPNNTLKEANENKRKNKNGQRE